MTLASALRPLLQALVCGKAGEKRMRRQRLVKLLSDAERRLGPVRTGVLTRPGHYSGSRFPGSRLEPPPGQY
jgi:hypothetical protein